MIEKVSIVEEVGKKDVLALNPGTIARKRLVPRDLLVKPSGPRDRGVFANRAYKKGQLIEDVPVIVIPQDEWEILEQTVLYHYAFSFGPDWKHSALALGYGSLYNHSYDPNAEYESLWKTRRMRFLARRDIRRGEEITINYNGDPDDDTPLWFRVRE